MALAELEKPGCRGRALFKWKMTHSGPPPRPAALKLAKDVVSRNGKCLNHPARQLATDAQAVAPVSPKNVATLGFLRYNKG